MTPVSLATLLLRIFGITEIVSGTVTMLSSPLTVAPAWLAFPNGKPFLSLLMTLLGSGGVAIVAGVVLLLMSQRLGKFAAKFSGGDPQP
jgi:hypothetical protein